MKRLLYRVVEMANPNEGRKVARFVKTRVYAAYIGSLSGRVFAWTRDRKRAVEMDDATFAKAMAHAAGQLAVGDIEGELGQEVVELEPAGAA